MKVMTTFLFAATLALSISCDQSVSNNDPELPPITMEGNNTFGCMLNGKVWLPIRDMSGGGILAELQTAIDTLGIIISADNARDDNGFTLSVFDSPTIKIGEPYDLTNPDFFVRFFWYNEATTCYFDEIESGIAIFSRFDMTAGIVAGTFQFRAHSLNCNDRVVVTEGRFDLTF